MALTRIEIAFECDDIDEDAMPIPALIVDMLGLDPMKDVTGQRHSTTDGEPVLVAVLQPE